jgi:outer membrane protein
MNNPSLPIALVLAGAVASGWAQGSGQPIELTFEEAIHMAGEKPAGVITAHERVQQAMARLAQARTSLLPQISAGASEERRTVNLAAQGIAIPVPGFNTRVGPFNTFDARLKLTQALFDAETLHALKFAHAGQDLAIEQKRKVREDSMALVATLYVEAKRAKDGITLGEKFLARDEKELSLATSQVKLGTGSQTDADEVSARLAESQRFLAAAKAQAEERRLDLAAALDLPPDQPILFKESPTSSMEAGLEPLSASELEQHPDVAVARQTLTQREAQAGVIKAGYVPKVSAQADYGASGTLPSDSIATYSYGGQVSVPLFEGGNRQKRVKEAEHQVQESRTQLEDTRIQTEAKAKSAAESVKSSRVGVDSRQTALQVADKELALAQQKLRLGVGTDLELIEQEAKDAQARDDWEEAVATYQMARVTLAQALGKMESLVSPS